MNCIADTIIYIVILFAVGMIFVPTLSPLFICFYTMCVLYMIIERLYVKTFDLETEDRIKMHGIAEFVFTIIVLVKLLKFVLAYIPEEDFAIIIAVGFLKTIAGFVGVAKFQHRVLIRTVLQRVKEAVFYVFPYILMLLDVRIACIWLCVIAGLAAAEELICAIIMKKYRPNIKSVFSLMKDN
ncbi:MAG TPA: hypothetical protein DCW90_22090 [Lachnospiraceae bacterium]|nr:hypothetical protein [uncultured Lachnoclostridium sp.]HAU88064.1 hypothetical protein [Lachnospiraceae bacterium]